MKLYICTAFLWADATATIYFTAPLCGYYLKVATIRGRCFFFGKPGDINDGWIGHERARRWRSLDAVISMCSVSVLLSVVGTTRTTQTVLALAWWPSSEIIHASVCVPCLLAAATIWGRQLFEGGVYSVDTFIMCMHVQFFAAHYSRVRSHETILH